jgi:hypothetical protein
MTRFNKYNNLKDTALVVANDDQAYSDGDVIGGLLEFDIFVGTDVDVYSILMRNVVLREKGTQKGNVTLYLFGTKPTAIADHEDFADLLEADIDLLPPGNDGLTFSSYVAYTTADGGNTVNRSIRANQNFDVKLAPVDQDDDANKFWGYLVANATITYPSASVLQLTPDYWIG